MDEINNVNESDGCWKIMIDKLDWDGDFYPTHILGINNIAIPIYITREPVIEDEKGYSICVKDVDYHKIDHTKTYILIHDPTVSEEKIKHILEISKHMIETVNNVTELNKEHIHIVANCEFDSNQKIIN